MVFLSQTPFGSFKPEGSGAPFGVLHAFYIWHSTHLRRSPHTPHAFYNTTLAVVVSLLLTGSIATRCCEELMLAFATFFPCLFVSLVLFYLGLTRTDWLYGGGKEERRKEGKR